MTPAARLDAALDAFSRQHAPPQLDARLGRALLLARPSDARTTVEHLLDIHSRLRGHEGTLRSALVWPTVTLSLVLVASLLLGLVAMPAFQHLPNGARLTTGLLAVPPLLAATAVLTLVVATRRRLSLGFVTAWRSLDAWLVTSTTVALVRGGTPLPLAVKSAAECCLGVARTATLSLAHGLEAGAPDAAALSPLLGSLAASLVTASAPRGLALTTLDAFAAMQVNTVGLEVRRDAERLAAAALLFCGFAFVATAFHFYSSYLLAAGV